MITVISWSSVWHFASYLEGIRLKPGGQLSFLEFSMVLLSPSSKILGLYIKLGHGRFLPLIFQLYIQ